ncbi:hypothetical protein HDU93_004190 [Gonapodya sp. JEL0774]|nr:hypothetical protein HDU93_004190 [Gonapodya sp. JEL0774]
MVTGATPYAAGKSKCFSTADCAAGGSCNTANNICYALTPVPANGLTLATGATTTLNFPSYGGNGDVVISGNVFACSGPQCGSGDYTTASGPFTRAEFTIVSKGIDFYDISIIDGFNFPVQMAPYSFPQSSKTDPYWCNNPGSTTSIRGMGASSWQANPPVSAATLLAVTGNSGSQTCTSSANCPSGQKCGIALSEGRSLGGPITKRCGTPVGYWGPARQCEIDGNCNSSLGGVNAGKQLINLYLCDNGIPSCYQDAANTNNGCCGCANWDTLGIAVPGAPSTKQCTFQNTNWVSQVQPALLWYKKMAPSVYTYPFDDMSSTFTCSNAITATGAPSGAVNTMGYTITWCPNGVKVPL